MINAKLLGTSDLAYWKAFLIGWSLSLLDRPRIHTHCGRKHVAKVLEVTEYMALQYVRLRRQKMEFYYPDLCGVFASHGGRMGFIF